jgi:hypothetical protein
MWELQRVIALWASTACYNLLVRSNFEQKSATIRDTLNNGLRVFFFFARHLKR